MKQLNIRDLILTLCVKQLLNTLKGSVDLLIIHLVGVESLKTEYGGD